MSLALAIPVWNDHAGLVRLLHGAARLGCFDELVVVDDGSDRPLEARSLPAPAPLRILRNATPQGAGQARNRALDAVRSDHLLFFDADDLLTPELPRLWRDLAGREFDFCLFRHADSRSMAAGLWSEAQEDRALWRLSGCAVGALQRPGRAQAVRLAETANFPWNKIYRTGFLRDHAIRCSQTPLHNDIALHWLSFARAGAVLVSDRVAACHHVNPDAGRLTNRGGAERLAVLPVLDRLAATLRDGPFMMAFLRFLGGLLPWIRAALAPGHHAAFDRATALFLRRRMDPALFDRLQRHDPVRALGLVLHMGAGAA